VKHKVRNGRLRERTADWR